MDCLEFDIYVLSGAASAAFRAGITQSWKALGGQQFSTEF